MKSFLQNCLFIFIFGVFLSIVNAKVFAVIITVIITAITAIPVVQYVTLQNLLVVVVFQPHFIRHQQLLHVVIHQDR